MLLHFYETFVLFIPYFCRFVFDILVTLLARFSFRFANIALKNVNEDCVIFSYLRNFVAKNYQTLKTKNGMNKKLRSF